MPAKKAPAKSKTSPKKKDSNKKEFVWSDDEVELLLNVANEYKVAKAAESVDWESVKSKYKDIFDLFVAALPEENTDLYKNFPHKKEEIKLQSLTSKLKAIRLKFRQAVDSGRRSGHGRVVIIYYELCEKIWGGSPATEQIEGGVETVELISEDGPTSSQSIISLGDSSNNTPASTSGTQPSDESQVPAEFEELEEDDGKNGEEIDHETVDTTHQATVKKRREFLDEKLRNYKHDKMKRKLPVDAQMLGCAQEELAIKKRLMEQVDKMDHRYAENMEKMSQNMEKLTNSIADGFALLKQLMTYPQQPTMYAYNPYMQGSPNSFAPGYPPPSGHSHSFTIVRSR